MGQFAYIYELLAFSGEKTMTHVYLFTWVVCRLLYTHFLSFSGVKS